MSFVLILIKSERSEANNLKQLIRANEVSERYKTQFL